MKNIVVFASGSGTNFQAIIDAVADGRITGKITGLIASKDKIGAIRKAKNASIPYRIINPSLYAGSEEFTGKILDCLRQWQPDLIILAGYMVKIPAEVVKTYEGRMINIHPSLLPKYGGKGYYGMIVHKAVLEAGETESGCTVHFVNDEYDRGDVIAQRKVSVFPYDTPETLSSRILTEEHKLLPEVIRKLLNSKII